LEFQKSAHALSFNVQQCGTFQRRGYTILKDKSNRQKILGLNGQKITKQFWSRIVEQDVLLPNLET